MSEAASLGLLIFLHSSTAMAAPIQLTPDQRQRYEKDLAHWRSLLDEYHRGKRDDNDGGAILVHLSVDYGILGSSTTADAVEVHKEWRALIEKHPEFKNHKPLHLHEEIEARQTLRKKGQDSAAARDKSVPRDDVVEQIYSSGNKAAVRYQYRLEFYEVPERQTLEASGGKLRLRENNEELPITGLSPKRTIRFVHPINHFGPPITRIDHASPTNRRSVPVCTDLAGSYYAKSKEEEAVIGWGVPSWKNPQGRYDAFCGIFDLAGNIIFQLPLKPHIPDTVILVSSLNDDDTAVFEVRQLVGDDEEKGYGDATKLFVWERPNKLHEHELTPDRFGRTNAQKDQVLRKYGLSIYYK
jgi:hypothetical protein